LSIRLILLSSWRQRERDDVLQTGNGVTPELSAMRQAKLTA